MSVSTASYPAGDLLWSEQSASIMAMERLMGKVSPVKGNDEDLNDASEMHALGRLGSGFGLRKVVSEYRVLRASVLRQWA